MYENNRLPREMVDKIHRIATEIQEYHPYDKEDQAVDVEIAELADRSVPFDHCAVPDHPFLIAGTASSRTVACAAYQDNSFHFVRAVARLYEAEHGPLQELPLNAGDISELLWIPRESAKAQEQFLKFFSDLMDVSLEEMGRVSDYWKLKRHSVPSADELLETLVYPFSHDTSYRDTQFCTAARLGMLSRLIRSKEVLFSPDKPVYLLEDSTLALPLIRTDHALLYEIARRFICECARKQGVHYMTVTKSLNFPNPEKLDGEICKRLRSDEHWFLRLPAAALGENKPNLLGSRTIPPVGAVTYFFKAGPETRPLRLDMSLTAWRQNVFSADQEEQLRRERQLFRDLDFACHDRRCYGYPYPLKAAQNGAFLTEYDQAVLRRVFVNEAVKAGLYRENFTDAAAQTAVMRMCGQEGAAAQKNKKP